MSKEGEFKKRIAVTEELDDLMAELMINYGPDGHCDGHDIILKGLTEKVYETIEYAKKELQDILCADIPDFQKLLAISAFKNKWFGENRRV